MQQLALHRAIGALNRIALGDLATAEYYTADTDADGIITLTPVQIVGAATRKTATADDDTEPRDDEPGY